MKKIFGVLIILVLVVSVLAGCNPSNSDNAFDSSKDINVISREDGSGTRGAFVELLGIEEDGLDNTTLEATISNSTSVVMSSVASDKYAIGYISLGSLNDTVAAIKVGGVDATVDNIKNGSYKVSRPFNIATKGEVSELAQDFINFILSDDGQKIAEDEGFISKEKKGAFTSTNPTGKITVAGSTSVAPLMDKLKEAYNAVNSGLEIEIQSSGSSAGMTAAIDGIADIGMASRELKDSELAELTNIVIALDGIAVVVNKDNTITDLTADEIKGIYVGDFTKWSDVE